MASKPHAQSNRILLTGSYAALVLGFLLAGVLPCVRSLRAAQADIRRDQQEIDARLARARELQDVTNQVALIHLETTDFERLVPPSQNLDFLTDLTDQLTQAGMRDISLHNLAETPLKRSLKVPVEVRGKGTFLQIRDFLTRLENLHRLCSVGRLSIDTGSDLNGMVEVQLTLYYYYAKPTPMN